MDGLLFLFSFVDLQMGELLLNDEAWNHDTDGRITALASDASFFVASLGLTDGWISPSHSSPQDWIPSMGWEHDYGNMVMKEHGYGCCEAAKIHTKHGMDGMTGVSNKRPPKVFFIDTDVKNMKKSL